MDGVAAYVELWSDWSCVALHATLEQAYHSVQQRIAATPTIHSYCVFESNGYLRYTTSTDVQIFVYGLAFGQSINLTLP